MDGGSGADAGFAPNGVCNDDQATARLNCPAKAPVSDQEVLNICETLWGPTRLDRDVYVVECYRIVWSANCNLNPPDRPAFCDGPTADPTTIAVRVTGWLGDEACIYNRTSGDLVAKLVSGDTPSYCNRTSFNAVSGLVSPAACVPSGAAPRRLSCLYKIDSGVQAQPDGAADVPR